MFLIVTATSRMIAPFWSVTAPERLAPIWARATPPTQRKATSDASAMAKGRYFTGFLLLLLTGWFKPPISRGCGADDFRRLNKRCQTASIRFNDARPRRPI